MMPKIKKTQKLISILLIIAILSPAVATFAVPRKAEAISDVPAFGQRVIWMIGDALDWIEGHITAISTSFTAGSKAKEWAWHIITELAKAAAMKALQEMTKSTVTWINSGYHGSPLFLENPESFFQDIAKFEVRTLVDLYGYDSLKFPFGRDFALNTISAYKSRLAENSAYSLSNYIQDPVLLKNYQNDFNTGGWNAFILNTQYPQNNYLGFQMTANEELARRVQGTTQTAKDKVQTTLNQGMGFLSPQACQTNPDYNNLKNEFKAPTFNASKWEQEYLNKHPYPACDFTKPQECTAKINDWTMTKNMAMAEASGEWAKTNECPKRQDGSSGLVNTTPGSVVANQIIKSVETPTNLKQMAINSGSIILSAVFDRLINKFITKGLNSLASTANPDQPEGDEWSYNGLTLGGSATVNGYNDDPWATPDEVVTVSDFGTILENDITKTESEIKYMTNAVPDSFGPGTMQLLAQIWPKIQQLDVCQPGPDFNWQTRVDLEMNKSVEKMNAGDNEDTSAAGAILKELQFAVSFFKDWINTQLKNLLPSSSSFMNAIDDLPDLGQQAEQVELRLDAKQDVLAQLKVIKAKLDALPTAPATGSEDERVLLSLWVQHKSMAGQISNDITLEEARSERDTALAKRENLDQLIIQCGEERVAKGWAVEGGAGSKLSSGGTEQNYFCDGPIAGGYSHKMFINPAAAPAYPQIPLVNAQNIKVGTSSVDITMSCATIFNANILDYKGDLPSF